LAGEHALLRHYTEVNTPKDGQKTCNAVGNRGYESNSSDCSMQRAFSVAVLWISTAKSLAVHLWIYGSVRLVIESKTALSDGIVLP